MFLRDVLDLVDVLFEAEILKRADDVFGGDGLFSFTLGDVVGFG